MCGIAGMFGVGNAELAAHMAEALRHRGPDDEHVVSGSAFALAARRLAIIDLEGGRHPLCNETSEVWVHDFETEEWVDARLAFYVPTLGKATPMGHGIFVKILLVIRR